MRIGVQRRYCCRLRGITHLLLVSLVTQRRIKSSRLWAWA